MLRTAAHLTVMLAAVAALLLAGAKAGMEWQEDRARQACTDWGHEWGGIAVQGADYADPGDFRLVCIVDR